MKQKYNGFTLIELMVSVALMLIIIGMTMVIFNSTSTTFTVAEAKVDIMQNARLALDTIAKDIANATAISGSTLIINDNDISNHNNNLLTFTTVTNWMNGNAQVTGKAKIKYRLTEFRQGLFYLNRIIYPENNGTYTYNNRNDSILAEYLIAPNAEVNQPLYFEYFMHPGTINTNWNGSEALLPYPRNPNPNPNNITIAPTDLPPIIRVTITVTDEFRTAYRTLSRMIWIPKGIRRQ